MPSARPTTSPSPSAKSTTVRVHLHPSAWSKSYLHHARIRFVLAQKSSRFYIPHLLSSLNKSDGDDLVEYIHQILTSLSHTNNPWFEASELAGLLLEHVMKFFPTLSYPETPYTLRLRYGNIFSNWKPDACVFQETNPNGPFCAMVENTRFKNWGREAACLISLAQIRGGGDVVILSVRDTKVYMLSANVKLSYLRELQRVPFLRRRMRNELVINQRGPWDMTTGDGREGYWQELAREFGGFCDGGVDMNWERAESVESDASDESRDGSF